jgi:hypothetical protein
MTVSMRAAGALACAVSMTFAISAAHAQSSQRIRSPKTLEDGTIVMSPIWMAAEMIRDERAAKKKYQNKLIEFEAPLQRKVETDDWVQLTFLVTVPSQGYKRFSCNTFDPDSMKAAESLQSGDDVKVAGEYEPNPLARVKGRAMSATEETGAQVNLDFSNTLRFDKCVVLTGNPQGERARGIIAASVRGGNEQK